MKFRLVLEGVNLYLLVACTLTNKPYPTCSIDSRFTKARRLLPDKRKVRMLLSRRLAKRFYQLGLDCFVLNFVEDHANCASLSAQAS